MNYYYSSCNLVQSHYAYVSEFAVTILSFVSIMNDFSGIWSSIWAIFTDDWVITWYHLFADP